MASTGNIRVNGGFENAVTMQSASLTFIALTGVNFGGYAAGPGGYSIARGAGSNDYVVDEGKPLPDSAAELAYECMATRATPIILNIDSAGNMHVVLENNVQGWLTNSAEDNTGPDQPGFVPRPVADDMTVPSLQAALRKLGTQMVNDGISGTYTTFDFSSVVVSYSTALFLDPTALTAE